MSNLITLNIDEDSGEAEVLFSKQFLKDDPLFRADILKDILFDVLDEYNDAMVEMSWTEKCITEKDVVDKLGELVEVMLG